MISYQIKSAAFGMAASLVIPVLSIVSASLFYYLPKSGGPVVVDRVFTPTLSTPISLPPTKTRPVVAVEPSPSSAAAISLFMLLVSLTSMFWLLVFVRHPRTRTRSPGSPPNETGGKRSLDVGDEGSFVGGHGGGDDESPGGGSEPPDSENDVEVDGLSVAHPQHSLTPSEDPPPPPDPPTHTSDDPSDDRRPMTPWWFIAFLVVFCTASFALLLRVRNRLRSTKAGLYPRVDDKVELHGPDHRLVAVSSRDRFIQVLLTATMLSSLAAASAPLLSVDFTGMNDAIWAVVVDCLDRWDAVVLSPVEKILLWLGFIIVVAVADVYRLRRENGEAHKDSESQGVLLGVNGVCVNLRNNDIERDITTKKAEAVAVAHVTNVSSIHRVEQPTPAPRKKTGRLPPIVVYLFECILEEFAEVALLIYFIRLVMGYFKTEVPLPAVVEVQQTTIPDQELRPISDELALPNSSPTFASFQFKEPLSHIDADSLPTSLAVPVVQHQASSTTGVVSADGISSFCFDNGCAIQQKQAEDRNNGFEAFVAGGSSPDLGVEPRTRSFIEAADVADEDEEIMEGRGTCTMRRGERFTPHIRRLPDLRRQVLEARSLSAFGSQSSPSSPFLYRQSQPPSVDISHLCSEAGSLEGVLGEEEQSTLVQAEQSLVEKVDMMSKVAQRRPLSAVLDGRGEHNFLGASPIPDSSLPAFPHLDVHLEWDESCIVDNRQVERLTFTYDVENEVYTSAAKQPDLTNDRVDVKVLGIPHVATDDGGELEELVVATAPLHGSYEDDVLWLEDGRGGGKDQDLDLDHEEEVEVAKELLAGQFDWASLSSRPRDASFGGDLRMPIHPHSSTCIPRFAEPTTDDLVDEDSFDMTQVLEDFYGVDGTKQPSLFDIPMPNFDLADVDGLYEDFLPISANRGGRSHHHDFSPSPCSISQAAPDEPSIPHKPSDGDSFDLDDVLEAFYGPDGTMHELLLDIAPPDFDLADVNDIYDDFAPIAPAKQTCPDRPLLPCSSSPPSTQQDNNDDSSFDLDQVLDEFYGPAGTKHGMLLDVTPPDFDEADVIDLYGDFEPIGKDVFKSRRGF